ncbi:MAG: SDR family oxidoreductase [Bacteroidota bacterium]
MSKQTIVVLGASRGIGRALVETLASNSKLQVIALARNETKMKEQFAAFSNVDCYEFDLSSNVHAQASAIFSKYTSIDFMINNAGYLVNKSFDELTHEDFTLSYQINVIGIMEAVQVAKAHFSIAAHIVNISSMGGFQGTMKFPGLTAYSTSKAALCSFTELFAEEHKESGLKMNCLCLGAVQTEMLEEAFPGYKAPLSPEKMAAFIADFTLNAHQWMNGKIVPVSLSTP